MPETRFIVAEVSKNYPEIMPTDYPRFISERFQVVIERNIRRGYILHSWQLHRVVGQEGLNETIVAVFERQAGVGGD